MADFSTLIKRSKKRFESKDNIGEWSKCDACDLRRLLFVYIDSYDKKWKVCEECIDAFSKEEVK